MTPAEKMLWKKLRAKRFRAYKFRRQVPIGPYIVDFFCAEKKLILEVDGSVHAEQQEKDAHRTHFLESEGYTVLRLWNHQLLQSPEDTMEELYRILDDPLPCPLP